MLLIVAQVVGITAVALYLISFQLKRRKHIVWVTCLSNALYVLQYILLGAFSGALLDTISTVSSFFAGKKHTPGFQRYVKTATVATILLIVGAGSVLAVLRHSLLFPRDFFYSPFLCITAVGCFDTVTLIPAFVRGIRRWEAKPFCFQFYRPCR